MKWSFFGKKRLDFCAGKSATSPPSPAASPFRSCTEAPRSPQPTDYVGKRLFQSSQPPPDDACSAEFLFEPPSRPHVLSPSADDVETAKESPQTPCSIRSCPEPEPVLGFCPNCHAVVLPLPKKRPHIRTNPWLWSKRARGATSITDSGIFDPSPVTSAESAQTPGTDTPVAAPRLHFSDSSSSDDDALAERREQRRRYRKRRRKRRAKQQQQRRAENNENDENAIREEARVLEETIREDRSLPLLLSENDENDDKAAAVRGERPRLLVSENDENAAVRENDQPLLLFPRARSRLDDQQQQQKQQPVRTAFRPILTPAANQTASPVFRLPQSDCSELWEVRGESKLPPPRTPPGVVRPAPRRGDDEDAMADAEVCEYSRRHVSHIRSNLRERIEQLKRDRVLLEERLQVTRGSSEMSTRQEECWTREVKDYRKQLLLRMLASAKGQVHRHLDRLQDTYDALLLEKLNCALESAEQRREVV